MRTLIFLGFLALAVTASAQKNYDMVVLKDGTVLYGKVIELETEGRLILETAKRRTFIIGMSEVESIKRYRGRIPLAAKPNFLTKSKRGYFNECEMGLNLGSTPSFWWWGPEITGGFSLQVVNGYRFDRFRKVGLGLGLDVYSGFPFSSVYTKVGGNLFEGAVSPLYWGDLGYGFGLDADSKGGLLAGFGTGLRLNSRGSASIQFSFGYHLQKATVELFGWDWQGNPIEDRRRYQFNRVVLRIGVAF